MKIYFNASLAGKLKHQEEYEMIIKTVKELGHEIVSDHVMKRNFLKVNKQKKEKHMRDFQIARKNIQESEVVIVEGTYPSIGVGLLTGFALDMYKPVLVLYLTIPHGLLIGYPNRLLTVVQYNLRNGVKLRKVIKSFLKRAKRKILKYKFNLMVSETHEQYFEWAASRAKVSKAEFLRNLIESRMETDSEYKKIQDYKEKDSG